MAAYCIGRAAAARGGEPALIVVDDAKAARPAEVWTFAQLEDAVLRIAGGLREAGLEPGARILIRLDNTSAYALLFFGAIAGGFVPLPTSAQLTEPEVRFLLEDSGAQAIAVGGKLGIGAAPAGVRVFEAEEIARMIARGPRARLRRHRRRRSGVPHLHLGYDRAAQGRAARAALRLGAPADVPGLVRHRRERPHAARGRLQLDLHARHRAHRSVGQRRDRNHLHGREGSRRVAAADCEHRRDAVCRGAGPLPPDPEIRRSRRAMRSGCCGMASWQEKRRRPACSRSGRDARGGRSTRRSA